MGHLVPFLKEVLEGEWTTKGLLSGCFHKEGLQRVSLSLPSSSRALLVFSGLASLPPSLWLWAGASLPWAEASGGWK